MSEFSGFVTIVRAEELASMPAKRKKPPLEYIPSSLRPHTPKPRKYTVYGVGFETKPGSFAMVRGPVLILETMLEVDPSEVNENDHESKFACVIKFLKNGTDKVLYRWNRDRWVRQ